jgi:3-deoxy-D-manno-octulosonic-acid transferase
MRLLYDLSLRVYRLIILIASIRSGKARAWLEGRKNLMERVSAWMEGIHRDGIWMHCASVGEFEQGRPVLEAIRRKWPEIHITLTFFSPSGYELRKDFQGADLVTYLPLDTMKNAQEFIRLIRPKLVFFVKYEYWHHFLHELEKQQIPVILISAIFRPEQPFFRFWGGFWRRMLSTYHRIYVQDSRSLLLLKKIGLSENVRQSGDTRFDRVCTVADNTEGLPALDFLSEEEGVVVAGSTWPADERILSAFAHKHPAIRFIIAPHEITRDRLEEIERAFPCVLKWSEINADNAAAWKTLVIDNIGMLSRLYRYARVAYVGGGFHRAGIHNILEAAVYDKPVLFGPRNHKAKEASDLLKIGGAFEVTDAESLDRIMTGMLSDPEKLSSAGRTAGDYVRNHAGATSLVIQDVQEYLLSSS